ncbi:hypothetical protein AVEN_208076-1 [Araneus ventricosus]|uniref:Uncharacterized protein n=1 Tax=Araneus ventricosus TaxID=182803 RepID=A0A4Y2K8A9_ARAVE|nr:hypothetical protein AVEN_208076-1 [Araneus ventricosus]
MPTSANEWLINFDSEEDLLEKHSFEIEKKVRVMPEPSSDIQKNTTFLPNIINGEAYFMPNVACSSFHHQGKCDYGESSHILHSSGCVEDFHVSHSSNLRNSTPKSSVVSHSNNLQRTPETASFANRSCNLQSSTPNASSRLSPFASDLTEVKLVHKNTHDMNQNTAEKNCEGLNLDISNDIFEFQTGMDSNYEGCVGSSLNFLKLKCQSTQNASQMSTYFSANGLKTPTTDVKLPMLTNKALKVPSESPSNSVNEYKITENVLKTLNTNSCRRQGKFSMHSSEEKYIGEVHKTCNSESLFESFDIHDSDLISFQDNLECKPNCNCIDKINPIDFSSDLNCKSLSNAYETFESTDQFACRDSLTVNNHYNESVHEIVHDILNHLSPEICDICSSDHFTEEKTCPFPDESNFLKEVFCMIDNAENLAEVSEVESLTSKTPNLNEFLPDTVEISEAADQRELNSENVNLKNDFDFLKVCNNSRNNIAAHHRTLGGRNSKTIKTQDIATNTSQKQYENSFPGVICKELSNLRNETFSRTLDICSDLAKSIQPAELLFVNSKPETTTSKKFGKNSNNEKSSSHMGKLALGKWSPFKMGFEGGSNISILNNFKTLLGKNAANINIFNTSICKAQENMLNFEVHKELRLLCNHNLSSLISSGFPQSVIISLHKLIADKSNSLNSYYSNPPHMKCVTSNIKPEDTLSNNSDVFLKSDLFSVNNRPSAFVQNGISLEICGSSRNSKLYDTHQMSNESKACEYLESNKDKCLDSDMIFKSKDFQNVSNAITFVPMHDETLSSQSNMFEVSRFPGDISETSNDIRLDTSIKSSPNYLSDSSESFKTDISMTSDSDSENFMENSKKASEHESKSLPLQDLFDIDKMVAKAVVQTFTDLGSSRGLKQSQIVKHINQRNMIKIHSKLNQDIQNFLKVSCEVGIMRKKGFRYFLSERTSSLSKKRKGTKNKCKSPKRRDELKVKSASTKIKTRKSALEMVTPTGIKRRAVFKVGTLASTKIKVKRDTLEMKTPTRIKTGKAAFQVETPAYARIKKLRKNSSSSSNAKRLFSGNKKKFSVCQRTKAELGSPIIYKKLRSRVILLKNDG